MFVKLIHYIRLHIKLLYSTRMSIYKVAFGALQMMSNEEKLHETLELFSKLPGITIIDTAKCYGNSEVHIGNFFRKNPLLIEKFKIISKVGINFNPENPFNSNPEIIRQHILECFERLGVEKLYGLMLHRVDPKLSLDQVNKLYQILVDFQRVGKVEMIGISEPKEHILEHLTSNFYVQCIEIAYSPFHKLSEKIKEIVVTNKIQVIAYTSALRGFLNNKVRKYCDTEGNFLPCYDNMSAEDLREDLFTLLELNEIEKTVGFYDCNKIKKNIQCVANFISLSDKFNLSPVALSLSYLSSKGIISIPGTSKPERAVSNIESVIVLDATSCDRIDEMLINFSGHPNPGCLSFLD